MREITYTTELNNVDWPGLKAAVAADDFDNGRSADQMRRSAENSFLNVFAYAGDEIVGNARALSDRVCNTYVVDVWTKSAYRNQGIARRMMEMIIEQVPGQHLYLAAGDEVQMFYEIIGFRVQDIGMGRVSGRWLYAG